MRLQGKGKLALSRFELARAGISTLGEHLSENLNWRQSLSVVQNDIGVVLRAEQMHERALKSFQDALAEISGLLFRDDKQITWLSIKAWSEDNIGDTKIRWAWKEMQNGNAEEAKKVLDGAGQILHRALETRARLTQLAPENNRWRVDYAISKANAKAYVGTIDELEERYIAAGNNFIMAAQENSFITVNDDRMDDVVIRTIEFYERAGRDYRKGMFEERGLELLMEALKTAQDYSPRALNREALSSIADRLQDQIEKKR